MNRSIRIDNDITVILHESGGLSIYSRTSDTGLRLSKEETREIRRVLNAFWEETQHATSRPNQGSNCGDAA